MAREIGTANASAPDGIKVLSVASHHGDAPAVAYRIEYDNKSVTFSGDIDPQGLENLTKLATDTDLFVFNCAVLDPPGSPAELYTRHSPPKRIGEVAKASGARRLILSHIPPLVEKARSKVSTSIQAARTVEQRSLAGQKTGSGSLPF